MKYVQSVGITENFVTSFSTAEISSRAPQIPINSKYPCPATFTERNMPGHLSHL